MNLSKPTMITVLVATALISVSFGMNPEHSTEAKTDVLRPDAPPQETTGTALDEVKPDDPSKGTTGSALAEVKPANLAKGATQPKRKRVRVSRGATKPNRTRVVGFGPAVDQFAANQALKIYWAEKAEKDAKLSALAEVKTVDSAKATALMDVDVADIARPHNDTDPKAWTVADMDKLEADQKEKFEEAKKAFAKLAKAGAAEAKPQHKAKPLWDAFWRPDNQAALDKVTAGHQAKPALGKVWNASIEDWRDEAPEEEAERSATAAEREAKEAAAVEETQQAAHDKALQRQKLVADLDKLEADQKRELEAAKKTYAELAEAGAAEAKPPHKAKPWYRALRPEENQVWLDETLTAVLDPLIAGKKAKKFDKLTPGAQAAETAGAETAETADAALAAHAAAEAAAEAAPASDAPAPADAAEEQEVEEAKATNAPAPASAQASKEARALLARGANGPPLSLADSELARRVYAEMGSARAAREAKLETQQAAAGDAAAPAEEEAEASAGTTETTKATALMDVDVANIARPVGDTNPKASGTNNPATWDDVCDSSEHSNSVTAALPEARFAGWSEVLTNECKAQVELKKKNREDISDFKHIWNLECTDFLGYDDDTGAVKPFTGMPPADGLPVLVSGAFRGADTLFGNAAAENNHHVVHILGPLNAKSEFLNLSPPQHFCRLYHWQFVNEAMIDSWTRQAGSTVTTAFQPKSHQPYLQFRNVLHGWDVEAMYVVSSRSGKQEVMDIPSGAGVAARAYIHARSTLADLPVNLYLFDDCDPAFVKQSRDDKSKFEGGCELFPDTWNKWSKWHPDEKKWNTWDTPMAPVARYAGLGHAKVSEAGEAAITNLISGNPQAPLTEDNFQAAETQRAIAIKEAEDLAESAKKAPN